MSHGSRSRAVGALVAAMLLTAACGHRTDRAELLAANQVVLEGTSPGADGTAPVDAEGSDDLGAGTDGVDPSAGDEPTTTGGDDPADVAGGPTGTPTVGQPSTPGETGPIVIGSVGTYSGPAGTPFATAPVAVRLWAQHINQQGGLFGRQVQVVVVDDHSDPAQHLAALRDLVENRKVVAFVSNAAPFTVESGRAYIESVGIPVIGTGCTNAAEYSSTMIFPQCPSMSTQLYGQARMGPTQGAGNKLAFIYCVEAQSCADGAALEHAAAAEAEVDIVYEARVSLAQPDYTAECRSAQSRGATLLSVNLDPASVIRFAQSCTRQGYNPTYLQASATVFYDTIKQPGFQKVLLSIPVFPFIASDTPARKEFQEVMRTLYGKKAGPAESIGWAAAKLFQEVATRAARAEGSVNPKSLVTALQTLRNETLDGITVPLTFTAGRPPAPAACYFGVEATDGTWSAFNDNQAVCR